MAKTFNRVPITVPTPSSSDIKQYFFNQYNWKGLTDNKNFLSVDQETFSSCDNLYIDTEGLLRSRPSIKIKTVKVNGESSEYTLSNIVDVWTFESVTIYQTFVNNTYYLTFVNKKAEYAVQVPLTYTEETSDDTKTYKDIRPIVADEKIFIFSEHSFNYYDIKENTYSDATEFIHVPVVSVVVDGIKETSADIESPNLLTTSYITKYLYTSSESTNYDNLVGKQVTVEVDGIPYVVNFKYNNQAVFVNRYTGLSKYNFSKGRVLGDFVTDFPLIQTSEKESLIVCSYDYEITDETSKIPTTSWSIYHTVDGIIFNKLPEIENIIGMPKISRDGAYCIVFKNDGPYIYSLLNTVLEGKKYPVWTNLLKNINEESYDSLSLNLNLVNEQGDTFNQSTSVNGYFRDDTVFAFTYGSELSYSTGDPIYSKLYCVYCKGDENIYRESLILNEKTINLMPNVYVDYVSDPDKISIAIDYVTKVATSFLPYKRTIYHIEHGDTLTSEVLKSYYFEFLSETRSPIQDALLVNKGKYIHVRLSHIDGNLNQSIIVSTIKLSDTSNFVKDAEVNVEKTIFEERFQNVFDFRKQRLILSDPTGMLVTNKYLFYNTDYTDDNSSYEPIDLLFEAFPVGYYSSGNTFDNLYLATDNALYTSNNDLVITVSELTEGKVNYFLPSYDALLSNYYFAKDNALYISSPAVQLSINSDKKITKTKQDFKWYLPEINKQEFDFEITNLHVISDNSVAIFFEHSVSYVVLDSEIYAYRYYKSKLQTGCKRGCDVITSYDGKYVIFTSERGLVAMTYQEFVTTTEQALSYLSDTIYTSFQNYITESNSTNAVKLFKHSYWIFLYKQDTNKLYILDIRNNSWWPITLLNNTNKLVSNNDVPELLSNKSVYSFDKSETNYYDYDGKQHKISWYAKSQKLHLNAVNYYKHIVNITLTSVHDIESLRNSNYNTETLDFKLQVNNYRKQVEGNINDEDDYVSINYDVGSAKTYVQRLNYSKVNEFQYLISSNDENAINIPLSLNSITIKYKIGAQVR